MTLKPGRNHSRGSFPLSVCLSPLSAGNFVLHFSTITPSSEAITSDRGPVGLDTVYPPQRGNSSSRTGSDKREGGGFFFWVLAALGLPRRCPDDGSMLVLINTRAC